MNWGELDSIHVANPEQAAAAFSVMWSGLGAATTVEQHGDAFFFHAERGGGEQPHNIVFLPDPSPPPPPAPFWFDGFKEPVDGVNVLAHTANIGGTYTAMRFAGSATIVGNNVRADAQGNGYLPEGQPAGGNCYVELGLAYVGDVGSDEASIYLRLVAPGDWSGYEVAASATAISLYRLDLSARNLLASVPWSPGFGLLRFTANGNNLSVSWNGAEAINVTDSVYAAGSVGFGVKGWTETGGFLVDNAQAFEI